MRVRCWRSCGLDGRLETNGRDFQRYVAPISRSTVEVSDHCGAREWSNLTRWSWASDKLGRVVERMLVPVPFGEFGHHAAQIRLQSF
jgi:hypothetical protein